jgi:hypothetical protein
MPHRGLISNGRWRPIVTEEEFKMFTRKSMVRGAVFATVAALTLTAVMPTEASARRLRGAAGGAVAAAAIAGIVGTGIAIAASQDRGYYGDGYYGGGPVYVSPGPGYYGGGYYGGGDPSYGPGPHGYGTTVPYVNGHPVSSW